MSRAAQYNAPSGSLPRSDLWNAHAGHTGLIIEDASEMIAIGKNLSLQWQERATGIY